MVDLGDRERESLPLLSVREAAPPEPLWTRAWTWLKNTARSLKRETFALWIASSDPRMPLLAKVRYTSLLFQVLADGLKVDAPIVTDVRWISVCAC